METKAPEQGPVKQDKAPGADKLLDALSGKIEEVFQGIRDSRQNGVERGIEAALQEQARDMALSAIRTRPELRDALRALVERTVEEALLGTEEEEEGAAGGEGRP